MGLIRKIKNLYHLFQACIAIIYYRFPAKRLTVIGVTGTDGKTTTSTLIYHFLKTAGHKVALISTVAAYIGDEAIDTGFHVTSPDSFSLQRLLRRIVDQGYTEVVLESTSHGLDQFRLAGTWIKTATITNVSHEHLDYHQTYTNYVAAKAKLFTHAKTVILNRDDSKSYSLLKKYLKPKIRWIAYSLDYSQTSNFPFTTNEFDQLIKVISSRYKEKFNHSNALAAAITAYLHNVPFEIILSAIPNTPSIPGRMNYLSNQLGINAIVDFAHTPNALKQTLSSVKQQTKGRLICVFGAAGARDRSKRPLMGKIASEYADEIILTSEDPRHEDPHLIINQIKSGIDHHRGHVHGIIDREQAIQFAVSLCHSKDTVIVCGKGHETSINMDGVHELPWSDTAALSQALSSYNPLTKTSSA